MLVLQLPSTLATSLLLLLLLLDDTGRAVLLLMLLLTVSTLLRPSPHSLLPATTAHRGPSFS